MRTPIKYLLVFITILIASIFQLACSDDGTGPGSGNGPWEEFALPDSLPPSNLTSIAVRDTRILVLGTTGTGGTKPDYLLETDMFHWNKLSLPVDTDDFLFAVALDASGKGVLVGANSSGGGSPLVIAERPTWTRVSLPVSSHDLREVAVDASSGTFVATGSTGSNFLALSGTATGTWTQLSLPSLGDPQDKSLVDVAYGSGTWAACGFDDGADGTEDSPFSVVLMNDGSGWTLMKGLGCGACGNREYRAVAVNQAGAILLGGAITDFSTGAEDDYVAFLMQYDPVHDKWSEIVLPEAGALDRVDDILVAESGDIYLACGESNAALVRISSAGKPTIEWRGSEVLLEALAQSYRGDILAVGSKGPLNAFPRNPFMLWRPVSLAGY
jgi:hypothetical protein